MSKTLKYLITGLLSLPALVSCDVLEPFIEILLEPAEPSYLNIGGRTLVEAFDTSLTFDISCDIGFTAELEGGDWASITTVERNQDKTGGSVNIRFPYNTAEEERVCTLVVKSGSAVTKKEFKQFGISDFFSPRSVVLPDTDRTSLSFSPPRPWTARISKGEDWFTIYDTSGLAGKTEIYITPKGPNENVGPREGCIVVTIDGNDLEVIVTQGQKDVIYAGSEEAYSFDWKGGELSFNTRFNIDYDVQLSEDWIHHVSTKALNQAGESFLIDEHPGEEPRTAVINFVGKANTQIRARVSVTQTGLDNVLRQSTPGLYGIEGNSYLLGSDGWNHSSRVQRPDGTFDYRLMNPESLSVFSVTDLNPSAEIGDECFIHILRKDKADISMVVEYPATLIGADDGLLWFKNSKETYFIIQK